MTTTYPDYRGACRSKLLRHGAALMQLHDIAVDLMLTYVEYLEAEGCEDDEIKAEIERVRDLFPDLSGAYAAQDRVKERAGTR